MDFEKLIFRCIDKMEAESLTNKDVARLAQISESTVSRVLATRGAAASASSIKAICDALGVSPEPERFELIARSATKDEIYLARIDDLKSMIQTKNRWIKALFVVCLALTAFVLILFAVDLLNPSVGWFRS